MRTIWEEKKTTFGFNILFENQFEHYNKTFRVKQECIIGHFNCPTPKYETIEYYIVQIKSGFGIQ